MQEEEQNNSTAKPDFNGSFLYVFKSALQEEYLLDFCISNNSKTLKGRNIVRKLLSCL